MQLTTLISQLAGNGASHSVKTQVGPVLHHPVRLPGAHGQAGGGEGQPDRVQHDEGDQTTRQQVGDTLCHRI